MAKFSILSSDIQRVVSFASNAVEKDTKSNLFFKVQKDKIFLFARGTQISIKFSFDAKIESDGLFCINGSLFLAAVKEFKSDILDFSLVEDKSINRYFLYIAFKELKIKLSADTFKEQDIDFTLNVKTPETFTIKLSDFLKASSKIIHCVSTGSDRPNLSGIMMHTENKILHFVSTDGRKLGLVKIPFESDIEINEFILPKKLFEQISSLSALIPAESLLTIQKIQNGLIFITKDIIIRSSLIEGKFPQYKSVIPKNNNIIVDFKTEDLSLVLRRVSSIALKNDNLHFELEVRNDKLFVSLETDGNSAKDELQVSCSEGEGFILKIKIPLKSFMDLIDKISTTYCRFQLSTDQSPLMISPINDFSESLFVIALTNY